MPRRARPLPESLGVSFSVQQAKDAGVSERRLRHGDLDAPFHGVRVHVRAMMEAAETAQTAAHQDVSSLTIAANFHRSVMLTRARAYSLVAPSHMFYRGITAAVIWGVPLPLRCVNPTAHERVLRKDPGPLELDPPRALEVGVLEPGRASRAAGIEGRQLSAAITVLQEHAGLRVVSPATMWAQVANELTVDELIAVGDAVVNRQRVLREGRMRRTPGLTTIARLSASMNAGRRVGAVKLREALAQIRVGSASQAETDVRLALGRAGLPEPTLDLEVIGLRGERIGFTEIAYPEYRVLVEYEGDHHRVDRAQWHRDIQKHAQAAAAGWSVLRLTSRDVYPRADAAVWHVREALLRAGWRP